jgi:hypothetical protein
MGIKYHGISINKISFNQSNQILLSLNDGRNIVMSLKYFPELHKLSKRQLMKYTIVDDLTVLFKHAESIYHLEDFVSAEERWKAR